MKKNRNGFTLVELLLVIAILAIIMAITIPMVMEITNSSRKKAFYLYGLNLVSKATETYVANYSDLDSFSTEKYEQASCVVYNLKTDLSLKNTGNYEGWVKVVRKEPKTTDINTKVVTVDLQVDHIPTEAENEEYYKTNKRYIDGIMYPKYCITSESSCAPKEQVNVQENQYKLSVSKSINKGERLCANYQVYNQSTNKFEETEPICKAFDDPSALLLPTDYTYSVEVTYKDNTYALQSVDMEGMKEQDFNELMELEYKRRAGLGVEKKLVIYRPLCPDGWDENDPLGEGHQVDPPISKETEKPVKEEVLLKSLTVSGCSIDFKSGQTSYSCEVPNTISSVKVHAEPMVTSTTVKYDPEYNLSIGRNTITLSIEDINGNTNRYVVYVNRLNSNTTRTTVTTTTTTRSTRSKGVVIYTTREITTAQGAPDPTLPESNAQLEFLTISKHQDFEFDPDVYYYDLKIDKGEDMLYLNYRAKNPKATVVVTGNSNLKDGSQVEILVRSENDYYTKSYIINVYREGNAISYTLLFRIIAIVLGIILAVVLIWLTLTRRSMRPKKGKQVQVITKTTQNGPSTSVFDNQPKKVVVNTNQNNDNNNNTN